LLKKNVENVISRRLVLQFSDAFLQEIISKVIPQPREPIAQMYDDIKYLLAGFLHQKPFEARNKIWEHFLEYFLFKEEKRAVPVIIIKLFVLKLSKNQLETFTSAIEGINQRIETKSIRTILYNLAQLIEKKKQNEKRKHTQNEKENTNGNIVDLQELLPETLRSLLPDESTIEKDVPIDEEHLKELLLLKEKAIINTKENRKAKSITPEDVFYVINSGIVILHPFLEPYFIELELMENKEFLSEDLRSRGVLLLHYLATGNEEVAEFDLTLQKILCGFLLEETLPAQIELTEKEKAESAKLLQSVTDYWPPLKNTSAEGLQTSFLQREGKLSLTDNGWLLVIEQKTIDILLGKLPWGFSTIRLPWMKEIVSVDWY
ncbi:MAG: hypothetical protein JWQ09_3800, partial [Segetibacter sp.]|nr:hypothetical protein [Segetibacter sp.]